MAKVKVFLSFEFDKDNELHHNFYAQAADHSGYKIEDYSLKEAYKPHNDRSWLKKARDLISRSDIVIVVTGQDAHNALGVEKEVTIANQQGKQMFQIRPQGRTSALSPGQVRRCRGNGRKLTRKSLSAWRNDGSVGSRGRTVISHLVLSTTKKEGIWHKCRMYCATTNATIYIPL